MNEATAQTQQMEKMSSIGMKDLDQAYDLACQDQADHGHHPTPGDGSGDYH